MSAVWSVTDVATPIEFVRFVPLADMNKKRAARLQTNFAERFQLRSSPREEHPLPGIDLGQRQRTALDRECKN